MATKISDIVTHATTPLTGDEKMEMTQGGNTVYVTPQDIANLAGGGGDTLYTADGTITDPSRIVTMQTNGSLFIGPDASNRFSVQDDGGAYIMLTSNDTTIFLIGGVAYFYAPLSCLYGVNPQPGSFDANSYSNTLYTNETAESSVLATLPEGATTGTTYHFAAIAVGFGLGVTTTGGDTLKFWDADLASVQTASPSPLSYLYLNEGQSCTVVKVGATTWFATVNNGGTYLLD